MTATNMSSNFGGKWDSPPALGVKSKLLFLLYHRFKSEHTGYIYSAMYQ